MLFKHYAAVNRWTQQDLNGQNKGFMSPKIKIKLVPKDP